MPMYGSDAIADGQVFFGGLDGNVYAFGPVTGTVSGTVTDAAGQAPIADATVSCTCSTTSTTTDTNGDYSFPGVAPASDYSLSFSASGYAPQTFDNVTVAAGGTTVEDAQLALGVGGTINGLVTDATATGNPSLPGVTVVCTCQGGSAITDSFGMYSFTGLPSGTYSLTFSATGFVPDSLESVAVTAGGTTTDDVALIGDGSIGGTVTDAGTGNPIAGATVDCTCQAAGISTDSGGAYLFTDVPAGTYVVSVGAAGYSPASNSDVVVSAGAVTTQDFALASNHTVVFSDGFESGNFSAWTVAKGLVIESTRVHTGTFAARVNTTRGGGFARKSLTSTYTAGFGRVWFDVTSAASQVNVIRLDSSSGAPIASLYLTPSKRLAMKAGSTTVVSPATVSTGSFHELELGIVINSASSTTQVWLDGVLVPSLSRTVNLGTAPIAQLQIGQATSGGTYNVIFDDAAFDTLLLP